MWWCVRQNGVVGRCDKVSINVSYVSFKRGKLRDGIVKGVIKMSMMNGLGGCCSR